MKHFRHGEEIKIKTRDDEKKREFSDTIIKKNTEMWSDVWNKTSIKELRRDIVALSKLENDGGNCFMPNCGKPWVKVEKENMYHSVKYYNPSCWCFFKCPLCGRSLHFEQFSGFLEKPKIKLNSKGEKRISGISCNCGYILVNGETSTKLYGRKYEKENFEYLNKQRKANNIYYEMPDGKLVIERIKL